MNNRFLALLILVSAFAAPLLGQTLPTGSAAIEIPFRIVRERIVVPVHVGERGPFAFMVDLGADGVGRFDTRLLDSLGLAPTGSELNSDGINTRATPTVRAPRMRLGSFDWAEPGELFTRNYNANVQPGPDYYYGLLGIGFFEHVLLTIDFSRNVLRLEQGRLTPETPGALSYGDDGLVVPIRVGGHPAMGMLDTGSSLELHLPSEWESRLGLRDVRVTGMARRANSEFPISGTATPVDVSIGTLVARSERANLSSLAPRVNIGNALLRRAKAVITLDQRSRLVRVTAAARSLPQSSAAQTTAQLPADSTARARRFIRWFFTSQADSLWAHVAPDGRGPLASRDALLDMLQQVNSRVGTVGDVIEEYWGWQGGTRQIWHKRPVSAAPEPVVLRFVLDSAAMITRIAFQLATQAPAPDSGRAPIQP